jgi:hypothetical protein
MSDRFEDREELANKIEWEGGIIDALDYGIKTENMPEGDTELAEAWGKLEAAYHELTPLTDAVEKLLEDRPLSPADTDGE